MRAGLRGCSSRAGVLLLAASLGACSVRHLLYPAPGFTVGPPPEGLEEVWIRADRGAVHAWWWPGRRGEASEGRPAILFFHGNGENLESLRLAGTIDRLVELGSPFLAIDYPGYGRSEGTASEERLTSAALAAHEELARLAPARPRVLVGWSLGAAVAMQVAATRPGEVAGLVLMSPWTRVADVARLHFPPLLVRFVLVESWDSVEAAVRYRGPALVVHGAHDSIIPARQGRDVAAALDGARWVELAAAGHNDLLAFEEPWRELAAFLERTAILIDPR